jgi:hypothetical protein
MTIVMDFFAWLAAVMFDIVSTLFVSFADLLAGAASQWWVWLAIAVAAAVAWVERRRLTAWAARRNTADADDAR